VGFPGIAAERPGASRENWKDGPQAEELGLKHISRTAANKFQGMKHILVREANKFQGVKHICSSNQNMFQLRPASLKLEA
jgi:hypothetical protein